MNGPAVGIGCSLALACDLIMAAESAFLGLAFVNIGLMPDGGSTAFVPPAVGKARAFQMALLGERIQAQQALDWGLVNWVYPDAQLMDEASALVERLARRDQPIPTRAPNRHSTAPSMAISKGSCDLEAELQHALGRTKDFVGGRGGVRGEAPAPVPRELARAVAGYFVTLSLCTASTVAYLELTAGMKVST